MNHSKSKLNEHLEAVQESLASNTLDSATFCEVAAELALIAELARDDSQLELERGANCLSQLSENLLSVPAEEQDDLIEFLIMNVLTLDEVVNETESNDAIFAFVEEAEQTWPALLTEPLNQEVDDPDSDDSATTEEEIETAEPAQIELLLSALNGSGDSHPNSDRTDLEPIDDEPEFAEPADAPDEDVAATLQPVPFESQNNSQAVGQQPNLSEQDFASQEKAPDADAAPTCSTNSNSPVASLPSSSTQANTRDEAFNSKPEPGDVPVEPKNDQSTDADEPFQTGSGVVAQVKDIPVPPADADKEAREFLATDAVLREAYLDDALRCLGSMEQAAMALEDSPSGKDSVQQYCRELHTLKGASATVGLSDLAGYLHDLETSLEDFFTSADGELDAEPLFSAVDLMRGVIDSLQPVAAEQKPSDGQSGPELPGPNANQTASAETGDSPNESVATSGLQNRRTEALNFAVNDDASIRIRAAKLDRLMDMLAELVVLRNRRESHVAEFNDFNEELARCATRIGFADEEQDGNERSQLNMAEIAKDISAASQGLRNLQKPVSQDNAAISRFIRDFRHELMQLRRVPVSGLFSRLQRAARDAAKSEGKKVQVKLIGQQAGLEQEIQEKLFESLLHVVRNSVSHGIESPEDRIRIGKEPVGTVELEATSNAQLLVITVRDDGGGINHEAIRKRGIEKGLIGPMDRLSNDQLAKLIFHPGFSTRQTASAVSGRGVGMDIVATTIEKLRGRIEVDSESGQGTTMRILIPLRTGIEHVMLFRAGQQTFALPMQTVSAAKTTHQHAADLKKVLGLDDSANAAPAGNKRPVIMVRGNTTSSDQREGLALAVDELVGPEEVVVRGLPNLLRRHPLFCGMTLAGSGEQVLLLDSESLFAYCQQDDKEAEPETQPEPTNDSNDEPKTALIVDDSLTARKMLSKLLRPFGFQVEEAGDGLEAIEKLHQSKFDLILTDLDMPRMGGLELLSDIQSGQYSNAKRVVVSSRNEHVFRDKATEVGANEFINKPVSETSINELLETLELHPETVEG